MRTLEKGGAEPADPTLGPAVRRFAPNDPITYSFAVYNPKVSPSANTEIQAHVFHGAIVRYSTQIKPISYFKANAAEVLLELAESREPMVITQNGEAKAVIQDVVSYAENTLRRRWRY